MPNSRNNPVLVQRMTRFSPDFSLPKQPNGTAELGRAASLITPAASSFTCAQVLRNGRDGVDHRAALIPQWAMGPRSVSALISPGKLSSIQMSQNAAKRAPRLAGTLLGLLFGLQSQSFDLHPVEGSQNAAGTSRRPHGEVNADGEGVS